MLRSLVFAVVLASAVGFGEESKYAKVVSAGVKGTYDDTARYMPQPYPIYVDKSVPYSEEQLSYHYSQPVYEEEKAYSGVIATISRDEENLYGKEVVRSPVILAVSDRPVIKRMPYPLMKDLLFTDKVQGLPCPGHEQPRFGEDFYHSVKPGGNVGFKTHEKPSESENRNSKNLQSIRKSETEKKILSIGQNVPSTVPSGPYYEEGSVQHRETFQSPIIIAEEKPGYKYVRHLVGAGVLPVGRQFHVIILEEEDEPPADKTLTFKGEENPKDEGPTSEEPQKVSENESKDLSNKGPGKDEKSVEEEPWTESEGVVKKPIDKKVDESPDREASGAGGGGNQETQAIGKEEEFDSGATSGGGRTDTKEETAEEVEEVEGYDVEGKIDIKMKT